MSDSGVTEQKSIFRLTEDGDWICRICGREAPRKRQKRALEYHPIWHAKRGEKLDD